MKFLLVFLLIVAFTPAFAEVTRDTIDNQQSEAVNLRDELEKAERLLPSKEAQVLQNESLFNIAEKNEKDESTTDTIKKLNEAAIVLEDSIVNLEALYDSIREIKNKIIALDEDIKDNKVDFKISKTGQNAPKTIVIVLSGSCLTMIKAGIDGVCPDYETLMALNLDTSIPESGSFYYDDNDVYKRGKPLLRNDHLLYDLNSYNIIIDPSTTMFERTASITISPNLGIYLMGDSLKKLDNTRVLHTDRYVENCKHATITASTWLDTIDDTIFFMRNGCEGYLGGSVIEVEDPVTVTNIAESSKWKYDTWLAKVKEDYKENKIGLDVNENPAVTEDED